MAYFSKNTSTQSIGVTAENNWGHNVLPKFCEVFPNFDFQKHYGYERKICLKSRVA